VLGNDLLALDSLLGLSPEFASGFNRLDAQDEPRRVQQDLVLRRADLRLDDLDGDDFPAQEARDPIPAARRALVGSMGADPNSRLRA
jgi:hypothetical protein